MRQIIFWILLILSLGLLGTIGFDLLNGFLNSALLSWAIVGLMGAMSLFALVRLCFPSNNDS